MSKRPFVFWRVKGAEMSWKFELSQKVCTKKKARRVQKCGWIKYRLVEGNKNRYHVQCGAFLYAFDENELEDNSEAN